MIPGLVFEGRRLRAEGYRLLGLYRLLLELSTRSFRNVRLGSRAVLTTEEGPSTQYLRSLVPNTMRSVVSGTRNLEYWALGSSGYRPQNLLKRIAVLSEPQVCRPLASTLKVQRKTKIAAPQGAGVVRQKVLGGFMRFWPPKSVK